MAPDFHLLSHFRTVLTFVLKTLAVGHAERGWLNSIFFCMINHLVSYEFLIFAFSHNIVIFDRTHRFHLPACPPGNPPERRSRAGAVRQPPPEPARAGDKSVLAGTGTYSGRLLLFSGLKTITMTQMAEMCKINPMNCCKCLVRYASPTIYNNSYTLLTHIFLQSLNSSIPFLPIINILTRGVRCMFRFPIYLRFFCCMLSKDYSLVL